ncbi:hypothetical protein QBC34DRAFT_460137 [Podospora aff. communis PSN243]|uniref:Uncharacterized protein n=1 Tax=Podospora aff. communis PSN243 TaxID=3040156 RepID=A0AAV9H4B4_9PEZI|nr:hypothetical protein QBC34DRAFT_460137 [Podospora aff. communis PSN243]
MNFRGYTSDPAIHAADLAGSVPPELSLTWLSESRDRPLLIGIATTTAITSLVVTCRLASSCLTQKRLTPSDRLTLIATPLHLLHTLLSHRLLTLHASFHIEYLQYVTPPSTLSHIALLKHAAQLTQITALLLARLSGLAYFYSISTSPGPETNTRENLNSSLLLRGIRLVAGGVIFGGVIQGLRTFQVSADADGGVAAGVGDAGEGDAVFNASVSLLCGVLVFAIPSVMVWFGGHGGKIPGQKGGGVRGVVMGGVLATSLSLLRLSLARQSAVSLDPSWEYGPILAVQGAEVGMTLIAVSVPGIIPTLADCEIFLACDKLTKNKEILADCRIFFLVDGLDEFQEARDRQFSMTMKLKTGHSIPTETRSSVFQAGDFLSSKKAFDPGQRIKLQNLTMGDISEVVNQKLLRNS